MKRFILPLMCLISFTALAQEKKTTIANLHEVRIGVGDPFLDIIFSHDCSHKKFHNRGTTGNLFVEYQYRIKHWLGVGGKFTFSDMFYDVEYFNSHQFSEPSETYYNNHDIRTSLMPTVRFTYFERPLVRLYGSAGIGPALMTYENHGKNVMACMGVAQVTLLGVAVGNDHWFGAFEIAPQVQFDRYAILPYSVFNLSVGYRF